MRAVLVQHDPSLPQDQRKKAYNLLEELKKNPSETVRISLQLVGHSNLYVQHYAFHSLECLVKSTWDQLGPQQHNQLKQHASSMFRAGGSAKQKFIREKICQFVSQIAIRDWPQRWPQMLPGLFQIAGVGNPGSSPTTITMLLMIIRNLASQIIAFNPNVPEKRCREIQTGLRASMNPIKDLLHSTLSTSLQNMQNPGRSDAAISQQAVRLSLETIKAVVDWVDPVFIYGSDATDGKKSEGVLSLVFRAFNMRAFCVDASDILLVVCMKSTMEKYHKTLKQLWTPMLKTNENLFGTKMPDISDWVKLMSAVASPLNKLVKNHLALIYGPEMKQIRFRLLKFALELLAHRAISVAKQGAEIWMFIMRYRFEAVVDAEWRNEIIRLLFQTCAKQSVRRPWQESDSEFELARDHNVAISALRSQVLVLMGLMTGKNPTHCVGACVSNFATAITQAMGAAEGKFDAKLAESILEGNNSVLEHVIRSIPADSHSNQQILGNLGRLLEALLKFHKARPAAIGFRQTAIGNLHPLYEVNPQALRAAVGSLIDGVQYRPDGKEKIHARGLSQETQIARRRALSALIAIAKKSKAKLLPLFGDIWKKVREALGKAGWLRDEERISLLECLLPISNAMPDPKTQLAFIKEILSDPLSKLDVMAQKGFSPRTFVSNCGLESAQAMVSTQCRNYRQTMWWSIDLLVAILRQTNHRKPSLGLSRLLLTPKRVNELLALVGCFNKLLLREFTVNAPVEIRAALLASRARLEEAKKAIRPELGRAVTEVHLWFRTVRAGVYGLLGVAAKRNPDAFFKVASASLLSKTAFAGLPTMSLERIKVILDKLMSSFFSSHPIETMRQTAAFEVSFGAILSGLFSRLAAAWAQHARVLESKIGNKGAEAEEIRQSSALADTTRSLVACLCTTLCVPQGIAGISSVRNNFYPPSPTSGCKNPADRKADSKRKSKKKKNPYVPTPEEMRRSCRVVEIILKNQNLCNTVMTTCMALMLWPDQQSNVSACTLVVRFLPALTRSVGARQQVGQMLVRIFESALRVLARLPKELEEAQHGALTTMCKELYCTMVPLGVSGFRQLLASIPGIGPGEVKNLEVKISEEKSDKAQRKLFKNLLFTHIVGKQANTGRCFAVRDLPEGFVASCKALRKRNNADDDTDDGAGRAVFEWLFEK